jgi:tRNA A-37 threonylcarbamoyl transferase component Bud32
MAEEKRCTQCGAVLAADAPQGLCPACLLKRGLESGSGPGEAAPPPTPADLARHFPELEILELIGRGGMGAVYKARQKQLDRLVALKVLPASVKRDPAFAERFAREAKALARLTHPNIVAVYDSGQTDGLFYFLMEFVDGVNLRQLLNTGKIAPKEALAIVPQICDALQYAHDKGIVHRDIKPENILLAKDGTVKIADFGLAKLVGLEAKDLRITGSGDVMGTPHYMAPEQVEHPQDVDHRADIYSLGVVFYQMLTGELPIGRFAPPSRKVQIDVRLDEVVLRALEKEPELRYQHASDVKTQVETILTSPGSASAPASAVKRQTQKSSLVTERDGETVVDWPAVLRLTGLLFVLMAAVVSLIWLATGRTFRLGQSLLQTFTCVAVWVGASAAASRYFRCREEKSPAAPHLSLVTILMMSAVLTYTVGFSFGTVFSVSHIGHSSLWTMMAFVLTALGSPVIAYFVLRHGEAETQRVFLRAGSVLAAIVSLPIVGFALFFLNGIAESGFKWNPAPDESVIVSLIWLGAVLLPLSAWRLWRAAKKPLNGSPASAAIPPVGARRGWLVLLLCVAVLVPVIGFVVGVTVWSIYSGISQYRGIPHLSTLRDSPANMAEQQVLEEFDWAKLAAEGRLLGGVPVTVDGRAVLRIENTNNAPLQLTLFKIENPPITYRTYVVSGEIKYENVQGDGYLEMWNYFPPPQPGLPEGQFFTRTLAPAGQGPIGQISGTSSWRAFALPFDHTGTAGAPTRLEVNIFLPGRGVVFLGSVKLMQSANALSATIWSLPSRLSPFTEVVCHGDNVKVRFEGQEYELVSISDLTSKQILDYCRREFADRWEKRFAEDLVEVLAGMGRPMASDQTVKLELRAAGDGRALTVERALMTHENRDAVRQLVQHGGAQNLSAMSAVQDWLALMDNGEYARSWETAAPSFQAVMTKDEWIGRLQKVRYPLGKVISRQFRSSRFTIPGTWLEVKFDTSFDRLRAATETVTFAKQSGGEWQAIGYLILPGLEGLRTRSFDGLAMAVVIGVAIMIALLVRPRPRRWSITGVLKWSWLLLVALFFLHYGMKDSSAWIVGSVFVLVLSLASGGASLVRCARRKTESKGSAGVASEGSSAPQGIPYPPAGAPAKETRRRVRLEIAGASLAPIFFIVAALWLLAYVAYTATDNQIGPQPLSMVAGSQPLSMVAMLATPFALLAAVATTILGWIAVSQIRRSTEPPRGLRLAVFDGLLFPLMALDGLIGLVSLFLAEFCAQLEGLHGSVFYNVPQMVIWLVVTTGLMAWVDYVIVRRVWRAVRMPVNGAQREGSPQRTEEGTRPKVYAYLALGLFLVGVLGTVLLMTISYRHELALIFGGAALVLALVFGAISWRERLGKGIVISTLVLFAAIGIAVALLSGVIPDPFRAQRRALAEQQLREWTAKRIASAIMFGQQVLAEFDWPKLAAEDRLLGGVPVTVDGRTALKIENTNAAPLQLSLFTIENPPITAMMYAVTGEIKYENVQGDGYLEMWNDFPSGKYFSRTLGPGQFGPESKITGTSSWRSFLLPFNRTGTNTPTRLEINIFLPGHGVVFLGPMKLVQNGSATPTKGSTASDATGPVSAYPAIEIESYLAEVPADFHLTPENMERSRLSQNKSVQLLFAPRVTTLSGREAEIMVVRDTAEGPASSAFALAPAGTKFRVLAEFKNDRVDYNIKVSHTADPDRPSQVSTNTQQIVTREYATSGSAALGVPVLLELGSAGNNRRLVGAMVFTLDTARITGIGVALALEAQTLRIMKVLPNSPAAKAGLSAGLVVQKIDGISTAGKRLEDCVGMLRGTPGSKVRVELVDTANSKTNTVELTRDRVL